MRARFAPLSLVLLLACSRTTNTGSGGAPATDASARLDAGVVAPTSAEAGGADAGTSPREDPPPMPYTPREEANADDAAPRKTLGTPKDWVKAYAGSGTADTFWPPRLRLPKELALKSGKLAFERSGDVYVFDFATQAETRITRGQQRNTTPRFFHDGRRIAFTSNRDGMAWRLWIAPADGGEAKAVTPKLKDDFEFAIAPDDKAIAYVARRGESSRMHLVDLESGRDDELAEPRAGTAELKHPMFSPTGDELYFATSEWDDEAVYAADVASRLVRRVVRGLWWNAPQKIGERVLLAAGGTQAYCCREMRLVTMAKDGSDVKPIPFKVGGWLYPKLSPKGTKIAAAWNARLGGFGADWISEISILKADGTSMQDIGSKFPHPFYGVSSPAWAPDDKHVALVLHLCPYLGCELAQRSVVVVDAEDPKAVPAFISYGGAPDFSPL